ncbi:mRNA cap guanine-N7 methyltransferase, putative [Entamoeba invadens IP1]|uniref:mRNA (guanine-N(7))-methyltransferase n=1 Tax=Entamoeba invadens IP1 TaxID=370355 RepID=L7FMZ6_ENTIV|nr:mRNA cap guanine-N7 methyltransferase, putative [Entamoeba invadens IP1]ELP92242.1 mRNA cap guanine-N7 methyltransferase, putative [Entamoeba invadens IP1]|eukprot:XP_004259013.1 mRNA cap guanine-N7 methyltransferase, putative [Entamoeba invadens IP1]
MSTTIESGYDKKKQTTTQERNKSQISDLRKYNNWVKACLIHEYVQENTTVLDFCGGKGGDIQKFDNSKVKHLVIADLSTVSLEHAMERIKSRTNKLSFDCQTVPGDCFAQDFVGKLPDLDYDVVSCQFAIHYSFSSPETARQAIENVTSRLKVGGIFLGTTVNAYRVVKKLRCVPGTSFGNGLFKIEFDKAVDKEHIPIYGAQYNFKLVDAIEDLPEFLIPFCEFHKICEDFGLRLVALWDLNQFYHDWIHKEEYKKLFESMTKGSVRMEQWEIIGYYNAFVFQKVK